MQDKKIKAVIFDIDGVLLDSFEANLKFFQDLMIHFGYTPPTRENYPQYFHLTMRNAIKALTELSDDNEIDKIWNVAKQKEIVPYPSEFLKTPNEIGSVLKTLHEKYSLGIATSRIKESIFGAPQLAPFEKYFKAAISVYDTKNHKPHPDPLLLAAKRLGIKPEECVYIGDVENDVKAAKAAGMKVIIYNTEKIEGADLQTSNFSEIPSLVSKF